MGKMAENGTEKAETSIHHMANEISSAKYEPYREGEWGISELVSGCTGYMWKLSIEVAYCPHP